MSDEPHSELDLEGRLREKLAAIQPAATVDPAVARRRAQNRHRGAVLAVTVLAVVLFAGAGTMLWSPWLPGKGGRGQVIGTPAASTPTQVPSTAAEWRTEWYRDVSFEVPPDWGYGLQPAADWCAEHRDGSPAYDYSYVSLGRRQIVRAIGCDPGFAPLAVQGEHVAVFVPGPAEDYAGGTVADGDWWISVGFAGSVIVLAVSKDRELAKRITASAQLASDPPCPATNGVSGFPVVTPATESDLRVLGDVESAVVCQYDPDSDVEGAPLPGGLRAVRRLAKGPAESLLSTLRAAPLNESECRPAPIDRTADIAVSLTFATADAAHEIWVNAVGCPAGSGSVGGIEDGTTHHRVLTAEACRAILVEPVRLSHANGDVGRSCLG
jgi:hypothetical protein